MGGTAAFFDIDGTLYREGLISEIFKKLVKYEIIDAEKWYKIVKPEYIKWDRRQGNYDNYLLKMADIYLEAVKGLHKSQVDFIANKVVEQKGDRVYTFTRDQILWHKSMGHKVITISGSPNELVRAMAIRHGFDDYRGSVYEIDQQDFYTGSVLPMWDSRNKKLAIHELCAKYELELQNCYAYGDTAGDFSMFEMVGKPICVNPTRELAQKVIENADVCKKIQIVVERKDMIYKLTPDNLGVLLCI